MGAQSLVHEVTLTEARDLSPLYTEAVREDRPVIIHRRGDEDGVLARLDFLRELLAPYTFHVHYYQEDAEDAQEGAGGGGYTLEIAELNIAAYGVTVQEARASLLESARSFVRHYLDSWEKYQHFQDKAVMRFYISRLALARDDDERARMLFGAPLVATAPHEAVGV